MFVPDKPLALRQACRVLARAGVLALNVRGSFEHNPVGRIAHTVIGSFFPADPPTFCEVPFGLDDEPGLRRILSEARFEVTMTERMTGEARSATATDAAHGLVLGNPVLLVIEAGGTATRDHHRRPSQGPRGSGWCRAPESADVRL